MVVEGALVSNLKATTFEFLRRAANDWERLFFAALGVTLITYAAILMIMDDVGRASAIFGIGFLSVIYSNLSRFKKFKGLGFEAELWEDKQKEAAQLIDRLKNVVSIYTREIIINKVMQGRMGGGADWKAHWKLFDELVNQHDSLGQKIDFEPLRRRLESIFIFDVCCRIGGPLGGAFQQAKAKARRKIDAKFGQPVSDPSGFDKEIALLNNINLDDQDQFIRSENENIAKRLYDSAISGSQMLKTVFDVDVEFPGKSLDKLKHVSELYENRPIVFTDELLSWSKEKS